MEYSAPEQSPHSYLGPQKRREYRSADEFVVNLFNVYQTMAHSPDDKAIGLREMAALQQEYPLIAQFLEDDVCSFDESLGERFLLGKLNDGDEEEVRRHAIAWFKHTANRNNFTK